MTGRSTLLTEQLNQTAVHWGNKTYTAYGGATFNTGVEISVRWEQKQELFIDSTQKESRSQAIVYTQTDLIEGEYLYLGTLAELDSSEEGDPLTVSGAYEIRAVEKVPDLTATNFVRRVWL